MAASPSPSARPKPSRILKSYKGNKEYLGLFNRHVEDVFGLSADPHDYRFKSGRRRVQPHRLQSSKVSISHAYYIPRHAYRNPNADDEELQQQESRFNASNATFRALPGVFWTSSEKAVFFECLARYSIHRVEEIAAHLPEKTVVEIYAYHGLLKSHLSAQKRRHRVNARQGHMALRFNTGGVPYSALPIAKEMDEDWEAFEEEQSVLVAEHAQVLSTHAASYRSKQLKAISGEDSLLNNEVACSLAHIYRANTVVPILEGKKTCKLTFESYVFLDSFIRLKTRELVADIIINKGLSYMGSVEPAVTELSSDSDQENSHKSPMESAPDEGSETSRMSLKVQMSDVWSAAERLKLYETPVGGFRSRHRDGKTAILDHYWQNVLESLRPITSTDLSLLPPKWESRRFEEQDKGHQPTDSFACQVGDGQHADTKMKIDNTELNDSDSGRGSGDPEPGAEDSTEDSLSDESNEMDTEDELFLNETKYLDSIDGRESALYRKALKREMGLSRDNETTEPKPKREAFDKAWDMTYASYNA